jgi:hypothetical protein
MFSVWKNPVEKCARSFSRCNVNRGKVTSLRFFGLTACSAVYYHAGSSLGQVTGSVVEEIIIIIPPLGPCGSLQ